jgi:hypothetical protein
MRNRYATASLIVSAERFPKVSPKFSAKSWESGEGGGSDHGESPSDT